MRSYAVENGLIIESGGKREPSDGTYIMYASRIEFGSGTSSNKIVDSAYGVGQTEDQAWTNAVKILLDKMGAENPLPNVTSPASDKICSLLRDGRALAIAEMHSKLSSYPLSAIIDALQELCDLGYVYKLGQNIPDQYTPIKISVEDVDHEAVKFHLSILGNLYVDGW